MTEKPRGAVVTGPSCLSSHRMGERCELCDPMIRREALLCKAFWAYGEHHDDCETMFPDWDFKEPCTCGYQDILNAYMEMVNADR